MKILVTGGVGFIGSWLVNSLAKAGHEVTALDSLSAQIHGQIPELAVDWLGPDCGVKFVRSDIRDTLAMDGALANADAVVHLAAETGTGQSMYRIAHYYDVNHQATAAMFDAIATRHRNVKKIVLASSRSIYGEGAYMSGDTMIVPAPRDPERLKLGLFEPLGPAGEPISLVATPEHAPPFPASIYAATKLANETLGRIFAEAYLTQVVALRFQNVYGDRQSLHNPYTGILSIFSNRMRQGLPINIFEDGQESRDFVHVSDVVRAIELSLTAELPKFCVINIGSGVATSVLDVAEKLKAHLKSDSPLQITGDFRTGDIRHCFANLTLAKQLLGFVSEVSLDAGLAAFCAWVRTQPVLEDRSPQAQLELSRIGLGRSVK
jgi:dTDP-L-rhamnose 4-epimerase